MVEHANGAMFDPPLGRDPYRTSDGFIRCADLPRPAPGAPLQTRQRCSTIRISTPSGSSRPLEVLEELGLAPDAEEAAAHGSA